MEASVARLKALLGRLRVVFGASWAGFRVILDRFGFPLGGFLGRLKAILGTTWAVLDAVRTNKATISKLYENQPVFNNVGLSEASWKASWGPLRAALASRARTQVPRAHSRRPSSFDPLVLVRAGDSRINSPGSTRPAQLGPAQLGPSNSAGRTRPKFNPVGSVRPGINWVGRTRRAQLGPVNSAGVELGRVEPGRVRPTGAPLGALMVPLCELFSCSEALLRPYFDEPRSKVQKNRFGVGLLWGPLKSRLAASWDRLGAIFEFLVFLSGFLGIVW